MRGDEVGHAVEFPLDRIVALRWRGRTKPIDIVTAVDPECEISGRTTISYGFEKTMIRI